MTVATGSQQLIILLDSGPLGLVTNPKEGTEAKACKEWLKSVIRDGHKPLIPEITDYQVRRELRLYNKVRGLHSLDALKAALGFVPITPPAMLQAAEFWADARRAGLPTADKLALDADVILAAQAVTLDPARWNMTGAGVVVATTNANHISRFTTAQVWHNIS